MVERLNCGVKGELHGKMSLTYMLGFGLVSGVVKVFPVTSLSLVGKPTREKRARRARMTKWDPKSRDCPTVGPDWAWANARQLAEGSCRESSRELVSDATRDCSIDRMHRPAPERSPTSSPVWRGETVTRLGIHFRHPGASCSFLPSRFSR